MSISFASDFDGWPPPKEDTLEERKFVQEKYSKDPSYFWIWMAIAAAILTLAWGLQSWYVKNESKNEESPFAAVTQRQFSLFTAQFPEFGSSSNKTALFSSSLYGKDKINPSKLEERIEASAELLFLYHTWNRLIAAQQPIRAISSSQFLEFLQSQPQWQPSLWKEAPQNYVLLVNSLMGKKEVANSFLKREELPLMAVLAFQNWLNFGVEQQEIKEMHISDAQEALFLKAYPQYSRSYWQNILKKRFPKYLLNIEKKAAASAAPAGLETPSQEKLPIFFQTALFNFLANEKEREGAVSTAASTSLKTP